jgi:hypothetical protein
VQPTAARPSAIKNIPIRQCPLIGITLSYGTTSHYVKTTYPGAHCRSGASGCSGKFNASAWSRLRPRTMTHREIVGHENPGFWPAGRRNSSSNRWDDSRPSYRTRQIDTQPISSRKDLGSLKRSRISCGRPTVPARLTWRQVK